MLALALTACGNDEPAPTIAEAAPAPAPALISCTAQASRDWSAVGSQYYVIEAEARGGTCAQARASLRIKTLDGTVLFERGYDVADVPLAFNPNNNQTGLRADLDAWTQNTAETGSAGALPPWPAGAARPPHFAPAVTRAVYENARGNQGPLFCFPDGAESNACVAIAGARATLLGSLTPERE